MDPECIPDMIVLKKPSEMLGTHVQFLYLHILSGQSVDSSMPSSRRFMFRRNLEEVNKVLDMAIGETFLSSPKTLIPKPLPESSDMPSMSAAPPNAPCTPVRSGNQSPLMQPCLTIASTPKLPESPRALASPCHTPPDQEIPPDVLSAAPSIATAAQTLRQSQEGKRKVAEEDAGQTKPAKKRRTRNRLGFRLLYRLFLIKLLNIFQCNVGRRR
jgi:hypothetical protein